MYQLVFHLLERFQRKIDLSENKDLNRVFNKKYHKRRIDSHHVFVGRGWIDGSIGSQNRREIRDR